MKRRTLMQRALATLVLPSNAVALGDTIEDASLASLMGFGDFGRPYQVDPYLKVAIQLQRLGQEEGTRRLTQLAEQNARNTGRGKFEQEDALFVLCRMLFESRPGKKFRRPGLGKPGFLGGTTYRDWPLEPIELVQGVPFLVVTGYAVGGSPETPAEYLEYCSGECIWRHERFRMHTREEKKRAFRQLLHGARWRKPVSQDEYPRFFQQI